MPSLLLDTKSCSLTLGVATMTLGTTVFLVSFIIWSYDKKKGEKMVIKFHTAANKGNKMEKGSNFLPVHGHFNHLKLLYFVAWIVCAVSLLTVSK